MEVVVFNAGIYDLTHRGHVELFEMMRAKGDKTISVIHDDKSCYEIKGKIPVQDLDHRVRNLGIVGLIDEIYVTHSTDPAYEFEAIINKYKKQELIYMRGDDLTDDFPGKWMLDKHNIPIIYKPYTDGVSSSRLRDSL